MNCFQCGAKKMYTIGTFKRGGIVCRLKKCRACGHKFKTVEKPNFIVIDKTISDEIIAQNI